MISRGVTVQCWMGVLRMAIVELRGVASRRSALDGDCASLVGFRLSLFSFT
jgi:hypothetical protein